MSTLARPPTYALGSFDSHWETASTPSAPRARREGLGRGGNNYGQRQIDNSCVCEIWEAKIAIIEIFLGKMGENATELNTINM
ncbi:unnamed protein product [Acanthoscelides obtectus]|uniref:Uncharacterized protein n=1 Tax=Acanthoscelides obtectus TaxID=200917 RepID=A0A9P0P900_ACAOB|nr:unnamed protein product [Acanthoscelides obtectus]CAK1667677.1 hypothetical protein AOBTE_LOCUS25983 [Acanthoscelides obtectus]